MNLFLLISIILATILAFQQEFHILMRQLSFCLLLFSLSYIFFLSFIGANLVGQGLVQIKAWLEIYLSLYVTYRCIQYLTGQTNSKNLKNESVHGIIWKDVKLSFNISATITHFARNTFPVNWKEKKFLWHVFHSGPLQGNSFHCFGKSITVTGNSYSVPALG
jgi:hypothetical protein